MIARPPMSDWKKRERAAVEAVAKHFSATWEKRSYPAAAFLTVAGKRIAVDLATLRRSGTGHANPAKPGLRFDKVATGLMKRIEAACANAVPNGTTVLVTVTAPIRLASKTAAALEVKIQALLAPRSLGRDERDTIRGNRVQIRILKYGMGPAPKMIGLVHNPETDPILLLNMASELLDLARAESRNRVVESAADRWLVVISARGSSNLEAYRHIFSHLRLPANFKKVLVVFADGPVGVLSE